MRFCLLDNAIVNCDNIKDYNLLPTITTADNFGFDDYQETFNVIKAYLQRFQGKHQLIVSTYYYLVPCFVFELTAFLGNSTEIIPVFLALGKSQLREIYDRYTIETTINGRTINCSLMPIERLSKRKGLDVEKLFCETGIETVNKINDQCVFSDNYEEVVDVVGEYDWILKDNNDKGCLFSIFSSLQFIDTRVPSAMGVSSLRTVDVHSVKATHSFEYTISLHPKDLTFTNHCGFWTVAEQGFNLKIHRLDPKAERTTMINMPAAVFQQNAYQVEGKTVSKQYIDITVDFLGNLHCKIESSSNNTIYKLISFEDGIA